MKCRFRSYAGSPAFRAPWWLSPPPLELALCGPTGAPHGGRRHRCNDRWQQKAPICRCRSKSALAAIRWRGGLDSVQANPPGRHASWRRLSLSPVLPPFWQRRPLWFAEVPTPEIWENLLAESPELATYGWPPTLASTPTTSEYSPTRWASNLTPPAHKAPGVALAKAVPVLLTASSAVLAGWGSFYYFQKESQQAAIQTGIESQDRILAELEPLRQAKQNATQRLRWIDAAQQLSPPLTTHGILAELAEILAPQGLVVRELELSPATLQMTVVSTTGNAPRLTYIISSIESHPWFYDVRFVDVVGGNGFKFALRLDAKALPLTDKTERDAQ